MERLYLEPPHMDKGWMLILETDSYETCVNFRAIGLKHIPKGIPWFVQGFDYQPQIGGCVMFEFFIDDVEKIIEIAKNLANIANLNLEIRT